MNKQINKSNGGGTYTCNPSSSGTRTSTHGQGSTSGNSSKCNTRNKWRSHHQQQDWCEWKLLSTNEKRSAQASTNEQAGQGVASMNEGKWVWVGAQAGKTVKCRQEWHEMVEVEAAAIMRIEVGAGAAGATTSSPSPLSFFLFCTFVTAIFISTWKCKEEIWVAQLIWSALVAGSVPSSCLVPAHNALSHCTSNQRPYSCVYSQSRLHCSRNLSNSWHQEYSHL